MSLKRIRSMGTLAMMLLSGLTLLLAGCGGGGGDGVSSQVVSGVAAAGAPLSGTVSLKDASATPQEKTTNIAGDGTYAIDVTGMLAPFIIKATGSAGGTNYTLCSFSTGQGRANVNPLSNLAVADAGGVNDPATVYQNPNLTMLQQIGNNLDASLSRLKSRLQALLDIYNAASIDPITGQYIANGTGMDALFDDVRITITGGNVTMMNMATSAVILNAPMSAMNSWSMATENLPSHPAPPAAPTVVTATGGAGQVTVSWQVVSRASSYNIYWSTTSGVTTATGTKITAATSPHIHTGLANSTSYYYIVTAVNSVGESAASSQASATTNAAPPTPTVPAAPSGVTATGGTRQVTVAWPAVAGATSYNIYWSTTSGVTKANGTRITGTTSPAVHSSLTDGTTYYYIVTAVNSVGESAPSAQLSAATLSATPTVPLAPTGIVASGGNKQVTVTWPAVSSATSYNLYWSTTTGVTTATGTKITGATSPYLHSGLADSTAYYYVLTAVNSAGESAASPQVTAATTAPALTCGTCHAIPPAVGQHSFHTFTSCATCHGTGYSSTSVNAATHMNGVKNVGGSIGWNAATRSCSPACHGTRGW
jgi:fibronectin type 3 domain-containing protein